MFVVRLPADPGQGYSWQLIDSSFSEYVAFEKEGSKNQVKSQAGGAAIQVFRFKALKPALPLSGLFMGTLFPNRFQKMHREE